MSSILSETHGKAVRNQQGTVSGSHPAPLRSGHLALGRLLLSLWLSTTSAEQNYWKLGQTSVIAELRERNCESPRGLPHSKYTL